MSEEIDSHILKRYKVVKKIGSGAYGHVWKVTDRIDKKVKALKKNFDAFHNSTDAQRTYREIMFLLELEHPNIIVLEQVIHADNDKDIYLVFEHMDIDLYNLIRENILGERHKKFILYQTCKAILCMHSGGLIHRDIKPSNILVCLLYTSPSPRDKRQSRMPSSA